MKKYRVLQAGRTRTIILIVTVLAIALYAAQKAWGLWRASGRNSDPVLLGLDLDKVVPAGLLTVLALAAIPAIWYLVVELLTVIEFDENGLLVKAPSFRIFYRWDEIRALDVITGPVEDAATCLQVETRPDDSVQAVQSENDIQANKPVDPVETYLSEADLREDKKARQRTNAARKAQLILIQQRAIRPDGTQLKPWVRLLYPQARRPDRLLLYPSLENRTAILVEIEAFLYRA